MSRPIPTHDESCALLSQMARAVKEHDRRLEPFASMSREEILSLMAGRTEAAELMFLQRYLQDKTSQREQEVHRHALAIAKLLIQEYGVFGTAQGVYLCGLAGRIAGC